MTTRKLILDRQTSPCFFCSGVTDLAHAMTAGGWLPGFYYGRDGERYSSHPVCGECVGTHLRFGDDWEAYLPVDEA